MGMGEILPPEFGVLLVGKVKCDDVGLAEEEHAIGRKSTKEEGEIQGNHNHLSKLVFSFVL
jgi:hypothetical protein